MRVSLAVVMVLALSTRVDCGLFSDWFGQGNDKGPIHPVLSDAGSKGSSSSASPPANSSSASNTTAPTAAPNRAPTNSAPTVTKVVVGGVVATITTKKSKDGTTTTTTTIGVVSPAPKPPGKPQAKKKQGPPPPPEPPPAPDAVLFGDSVQFSNTFGRQLMPKPHEPAVLHACGFGGCGNGYEVAVTGNPKYSKLPSAAWEFVGGSGSVKYGQEVRLRNVAKKDLFLTLCGSSNCSGGFKLSAMAASSSNFHEQRWVVSEGLGYLKWGSKFRLKSIKYGHSPYGPTHLDVCGGSQCAAGFGFGVATTSRPERLGSETSIWYTTRLVPNDVVRSGDYVQVSNRFGSPGLLMACGEATSTTRDPKLIKSESVRWQIVAKMALTPLEFGSEIILRTIKGSPLSTSSAAHNQCGKGHGLVTTPDGARFMLKQAERSRWKIVGGSGFIRWNTDFRLKLSSVPFPMMTVCGSAKCAGGQYEVGTTNVSSHETMPTTLWRFHKDMSKPPKPPTRSSVSPRSTRSTSASSKTSLPRPKSTSSSSTSGSSNTKSSRVSKVVKKALKVVAAKMHGKYTAVPTKFRASSSSVAKPTSKPKPTRPPTTKAPTKPPTPMPSAKPTSPAPSATPTTAVPTRAPTPVPTTPTPTLTPTENPTLNPTRTPSLTPTVPPSFTPTVGPTTEPPTFQPSPAPSWGPTVRPTRFPTPYPSTPGPTHQPSAGPTQDPTPPPSVMPSPAPSVTPSEKPSAAPSAAHKSTHKKTSKKTHKKK